jgi:hypothetical protein
LNVTAAPTKLTGTDVAEFSMFSSAMRLADCRNESQFRIAAKAIKTGTDIGEVDAGKFGNCANGFLPHSLMAPRNCSNSRRAIHRKGTCQVQYTLLAQSAELLGFIDHGCYVQAVWALKSLMANFATRVARYSSLSLRRKGRRVRAQ